MLLWLYTHVSSVCFHVIKMFQPYVAKVDLDVAYVAMAIHACFKCICFSLYVANVSSLCFKSRSCVAHVAIRASGWRTAACLLLLPGRRCGSRAGAGWGRHAWCCWRGIAMVHVQAQGRVPDAGARCGWASGAGVELRPG